ncbi:methionine ABC transporter ATP-binding protein [Tissierella creatinophila]|uniref:Methionine import ATP-binding protein MetN n=1 Tax=Tissierella creatinophila DSM 6911 TaxID=1123403 RepID=A0A1U7M707_TISCR|nr:ATP-binding cassette domain-containing protein [Tissierella creatinophila]OLS03065.1 methionine import ATP-binding protein MetN [Tissierella creatinophila DSM 6911]
MIKIENLNKVFETGGIKFEAIKDVNLNINDKDIYGIIGLSGAGKSTLIRCLNRLEEPTSGSISIEGVDILSLGKEELRLFRKKIGMIFQDFNLLKQKTVYDNVALPLYLEKMETKKIKEKVDLLLDYVGLKDKKNSYPSELSGGQKQRVAIARAIANDPKVLLSDEATSSLDPQTTVSILELLKRIQGELGITIIMITHQMEVVKQICNKVAIMDGGVVIEENTVENVFNNPKTTLAKSFIGSVNTLAEEEIINPNDFKGKLIRLGYLGESSNNPIVSQMIKNFQIEVNILSGSIDKLQSTSVGHLILELIGEESEIEKSMDFLKQKNVTVEVIE